jgi:hypothetical protein
MVGQSSFPDQVLEIKLVGNPEDWKTLDHAIQYSIDRSPVFSDGSQRASLEKFLQIVRARIPYR